MAIDDNLKYSVLMSLYKKEKPEFLIESIESMLKQTYSAEEILIVKDGPLTNQLDLILSNYKLSNPRLFSIVELKDNLGLGLALNEGLKSCRNELVARMDTDDISLNNRCELQIEEFMKNPLLCIVGTWINEFYDHPSNTLTSRVVPVNHNDIMKFSRRRSPFNHPTVMYKKSAVLNSGGYKNVMRKEDIDLFVRMLHHGCIAKNIPKSLLLYRSNKDSLKRRKTWVNCKSYIKVIYNFWRMGYSSLLDFLIVFISQITFFIIPVWMLKIINNKILRGKPL